MMIVNKASLVTFLWFIMGSSYSATTLCPPLPSTTFYVDTRCSDNETNCTTLSDAMEQLDSNTTLLLGRGVHRLTNYTPVSSLSDVVIVGDGQNEVTVECDILTGFSFINVTRLTLCGFTINGCGLTGTSISAIEQQLIDTVMLWFGIPSVINYGMIIGSCWNVTLSDLLITNTVGMGLLGINILGDSSLEQVSFTNNTRLSCTESARSYPFNGSDPGILKQIGGGAYFLYQDEYQHNMHDVETIPVHNLVIRNCTFSRNAECSYAAITQVNFQLFPRLGQDLYQVGAGGGLSVFVTQHKYNIYTLVEDTEFVENDARYGGGAHIGIFAGVDWCTVIFRGCRFERNGAEGLGVGRHITSPRSMGGSGLAIFTDMLSPSTINETPRIPQNNHFAIVEIIDTEFVSNAAEIEGGGLLAYSLFNTPHGTYDVKQPGFYTISLSIRDCIFQGNSAPYGAAAYFQQNVDQGTSGSLRLETSNVIFMNSQTGRNVNLTNSRFLPEGRRITSAVAFVNIYVVIKDMFECSDNDVTGILLQSTTVLALSGAKVYVERNHGQQGGGVHLTGEGASIGLDPDTVLSFVNNTATIFGGAVYISPSIISNDVLRPIDAAEGCFISPFPRSDCFTPDCFDNALDNVNTSFVGNTAPRGSMVYGTTLETCTWAARFRGKGIPIFQLLYMAGSSYGILFDRNPNVSAVVSTSPAMMQVLGPDGTKTLIIFPGQTVTMSIEVFDQFGFTIPATVTSNIPNFATVHANSTLGSSNSFFTEKGSNITTLTVRGLENQEFPIFFTEINTLVSSSITVCTKSCLQGFTYDSDDNRCICNDQLTLRGVTCDLNNLRLISADGRWVGSLTANSSTDDLVVGFCHLRYCNDGPKPFRPPYFDAQCREGSMRTGVECGACKPGYSAVLGTTECKKCSNFYLLLIPLFGVLGILLFVAIAFLEVTVDKGWVYSILFYSNVITLTPVSASLPLLYIPAHLLSFELGTGICFFDGMETIHSTFFKLLFPLYLYVLMLIFSLLSRKFTISAHFSPVKTLATIGVMSYISILDTCVEIFTAATLLTVTGERHVRWLRDANVLYFSDWRHCVLFFIAAVTTICYLIPVPLILLSPQVAFKFFKKLGPFFDAMWAPFKPQHRWWLGVRLLLRSILLIGAGFFSGHGEIIIGLVVLVMIEMEVAIRPFKEERVTIIDSILLGNIIALMFGAFYFQAKGGDILRISYVSATIAIAYALIIAILVYHFVGKWKLRNAMKKQLSVILGKSKSSRGEVPRADPEHEVHSETTFGGMREDLPTPSITNNPSLFVFPEDFPPTLVRADFSHLRESLLES